jgi:pyruvate formate lyase activating enzyme
MPRRRAAVKMPLKPMNHTVATRYWHRLEDDRVQCDLCPRYCKLRERQRGMCFVRARQGDEVVLTTYGRSSGFCVDPIEKKPLNHFLPGTPVLSFGTAGCNLACSFCQNWDISKSREVETLSAEASPNAIARAAVDMGSRSVAFTYNDPVIFMEYAIDVAEACHHHGIKTVAVTAGEICPEPRREFFRHMDAANVDLKGFTEDFYRKVCKGSLAAVLDTLRFLKHETSVWFEITTLLIPGHNDSDAELHNQSRIDFWLRSAAEGDAREMPAATTTVPRFVTPGEPDESRLIALVSRRGGLLHMPPLGSHRVDPEGVSQLRAWIEGLKRER